MPKLAFFSLALVAAAGCSVGGESSSPAPQSSSGVAKGATSEQVRAFEQLESTTKTSWTWLQHDALNTPMHLSAPRTTVPVLLKGEDPAAKTLTLLRSNRALFQMRDPALELSLKRTAIDELGMTHTRFQQMTHGIPVAGRELIAHYDAEGRVTSIDADYVPGLENVDVQPVVNATDARARVKAAILATSVQPDGSALDESAVDLNEGKLVVYAPKGSPTAKLAYEYTARALASQKPAIWITTVDAKTGEVLHQYNNFQTIQGQGAGVLGDRKTFEVSAAGANFIMTDAATGTQVRTFTARKAQTTPGMAIASTTTTAWDTNVTGAGAGVDAHVNAAAVFKYYKEKHNRNAIDGLGGPMISTVHFGQAYDNAAWDGQGMLYGDGGEVFRPLSVSLDIVGHEFTHGVTEKTSNLNYEDQSGALNEAVSDIFGAFIEHSVKPDAINNWLLGEGALLTGNSALRNMKDPGAVSDPQPSHMNEFVNTQEDSGGVHTNSGIINNAAFLMTVGGVNPVSKVAVKFGIGWEKSEKVWYRANTVYFKQTTNFGQAAQGLLQAAKDVGLTANETAIVDCAFKATGIAQGVCAEIVDPQAKAPVIGANEPDAPAAGDTAATDAPSTKASAGNSGDVGGSDTPAAKAAGPAGTRRQAITTTESGCNSSGHSSNKSGSDASHLVAVLGVVLGLASRRRKKTVAQP